MRSRRSCSPFSSNYLVKKRRRHAAPRRSRAAIRLTGNEPIQIARSSLQILLLPFTATQTGVSCISLTGQKYKTRTMSIVPLRWIRV